MDKNMEIIAGLKLCAPSGSLEACTSCPYNGKSRPYKSCRRLLCEDAAEALAEAVCKAQSNADEANELRAEVQELREILLMHKGEKTSVCSDVEGLQNDVQKLSEAADTFKSEANYWNGQADALKWFVEFYLSTPAPESNDAVEVPDDV